MVRVDEFLRALENAPPERAVRDYIHKVYDDILEDEVSVLKLEYREALNRQNERRP